MSKPDQMFAFIGSYAEPDQPGIYVCRYDVQSGELELTSQIDGLKNPTFLGVDPDPNRSTLYSIAEETNPDGAKYGLAASYRIDRASGALQLLNKESTTPAPTCHLVLDRSRRSLIVSSYHGGMIGMSPLRSDGGIGPASDIKQHTGSSVLPVQSQPRAHSVTIDCSNRFAVACDLGLDKLIVYRLDLDACRLIPHHEAKTTPGAGPRHGVFHPSGAFFYVINELNASIIAYAYDGNQGQLSEIQTVPTLPADYEGPNACADIHISPDGQFLYGSNRGHDSIVAYRIDAAGGRLSYVEHSSAGGKHPRNFAISPDGRFVLVANRDTDNVAVFRRDEETGRLTTTGSELSVSKPVCIKFLQ